uniref:NADH dehydrogenase subunit 6 n=1 Tax=Lepidopsocidae sp. RS-2001 TaxID=159971 RepID=Q7YHL6_9NEOP|nr:NADH dehydrogenase subunit 6 [Lepidopsocidae sp. RS-2001]AAP44722.1 NADH dehydrogenase subunit 6 [Lepidopsocidae sp. RS-2001]
MNMLLFTLLSTFSILFLFMKHPLSAGLILIMSTILVALMTAYMLQTFWFSYILTLILIGGMLILFIYMISLSPNQKFMISSILFLIPLFLIIPMMMNMIDPMILMELSQKINDQINWNLPQSIKLFNTNSSILTIISINYLFLIMIIVTKITSSLKGPLRSNLK